MHFKYKNKIFIISRGKSNNIVLDYQNLLYLILVCLIGKITSFDINLFNSMTTKIDTKKEIIF